MLVQSSFFKKSIWYQLFSSTLTPFCSIFMPNSDESQKERDFFSKKSMRICIWRGKLFLEPFELMKNVFKLVNVEKNLRDFSENWSEHNEELNNFAWDWQKLSQNLNKINRMYPMIHGTRRYNRKMHENQKIKSKNAPKLRDKLFGITKNTRKSSPKPTITQLKL